MSAAHIEWLAKVAIENEARAEALRDAADRVRALRYNAPRYAMDEEMRQHNQTLDDVLAILSDMS